MVSMNQMRDLIDEDDFSKGLNDKISVYSQSDFDVNLDHTDTTVGFKFKF